jgi:Flp pilus assembly protein TadB
MSGLQEREWDWSFRQRLRKQATEAAPGSGKIWAEMNLARIMGVVVGFLVVLTLAHMVSVRLAVLLFLLFAACLVYLVFIWPNLRQRK